MTIKQWILSAAGLLGSLALQGCFDIDYERRVVPCDEGRCPEAFRCGNDDFCYPKDDGGGDCEPRQRQCVGSSQPQYCDSGEWEDDAPCTASQWCTAGLCGGVCGPGQIDCTNSTEYRSCAGGSWTSSTTACPFACSNDQCTAVCQPGNTRCKDGVGTTQQTCIDAGLWLETDCAGQGKTCYANACTGVCAKDAWQCSASGQSQKCGADGQWGLADACSGPDRLCDKTTGACGANPAFEVGRSTTTNGTVFPAYDDDLLATPITPNDDAEVLYLSIFTGATVPSGTAVRLSIYTDNSGKPGSRIGYTNQYTLLANDANTRSVYGTVRLSAGMKYWLVAKVLTGASSVDVYVYDSPTDTVFIGVDSTAGLPPEPFPGSAFKYASTALGIYVTVRKYWSP